MPGSCHTKIQKLIDPVVKALARLIRRRPHEPESQEIHRKLDRIESALKEIDLALKDDDTQPLYR